MYNNYAIILWPEGSLYTGSQLFNKIKYGINWRNKEIEYREVA